MSLDGNIISRYYPVFRTDPDDSFINNIIDSFFQRGALPQTWIVSYTGTSQYQFGRDRGVAACGLCAANFARQVFAMYTSGMRDGDLFRWLLTRECAVKVTQIARYYAGSTHLEASRIVGAPPFDRFLNGVFVLSEDAVPGVPYFTEVMNPKTPLDGLLCTYDSFVKILEKMDGVGGISASIITAPPEIVAAIKIPMEMARGKRVFVVFDSHGNSKFYKSGSGIIVCPTIEAAAMMLAQKFQREEGKREVCASFVVPREEESQRDDVLIAASVRILELENKVSRLDPNPNPNHGMKNAPDLAIVRQIEEQQNANEELLLGLVDVNVKVDELEKQLQSAVKQIVVEQCTLEETRIAARRDVLALQKRLEEKEEEVRERDELVLRLTREVRAVEESARRTCSAAENEVMVLRNSLRESSQVVRNLQHQLWTLGRRRDRAQEDRAVNQVYDQYEPPLTCQQCSYTGTSCTRSRPTANANNRSRKNVRETTRQAPAPRQRGVHEPTTSPQRHHLGENQKSGRR